MRAYTTALIASLLVVSAEAGDILLTARGSVTAVVGGIPDAPFSAVTVGETVEITIEAINVPSVNTPTFWEYTTDPLRGGLQIGNAFLPSWAAIPGQVNLQNEAADAVTFGLPLAMPFATGLTAGLIDVSGQFLQSPDLGALIGQTLTATFPGAAALASTSNPAVIQIEIVSIEVEVGTSPLIGVNSCDAESNSTFLSAVTYASGSEVAAQNDITLAVGALPADSFGFFLASTTSAFSSQPGGSSGNLCLGGGIGRYVGPGQIQTSGAFGTFDLPIDLTQMPTPNGPVAAAAGETWHFTTWYRDTTPAGTATSNFSDRLSIVLQ